MLLNLMLDAYLRARKTGVDRALRESLSRILGRVGLEPEIEVSSDGRKLGACEIIRYRLDGNEYVALLRDAAVVTEAEEIHVRFPGKRHLYDMRKAEVMGRTDWVNTRIDPQEPTIFALMGYEIAGLELLLEREIVALGAELRFRIVLRTSDTAGTHCFRIELEDPMGRECPWAAENVFGVRGEYDGSLRIACNDAPGKWTLKARDVATGHQTKAAFTVSSGGR